MIKIFAFLIATCLAFYRGYLVNNYLRRKQGLNDQVFMEFYNDLLYLKGVNKLMFIIPFFTATENVQIKKLRNKINVVTFILYLSLAVVIIVNLN